MRPLTYIGVRLNYVKLTINGVLDKIKQKYHVYRSDGNIVEILQLLIAILFL